MRVRARFADGSEEDVTALCDFRVQDDAVAEVTQPGEVKALRPGDTALVVSYRGNVRPVRVLVPMPAAPGFRYPQTCRRSTTSTARCSPSCAGSTSCRPTWPATPSSSAA